jgi:hypothetical protein
LFQYLSRPNRPLSLSVQDKYTQCLERHCLLSSSSSSSFTPLPLQLAFQCSAVTRPTGTHIKRVGNNTKLACASGRQSVILVSHTRIESSIYILLIVSPMLSPCLLWRGILGASTNSRVGTAMSTISVPMFAINGAEGRGSSIGWIPPLTPG